MEVMLIPLLILFFILVAGFGIENTFKILPPLIILGKIEGVVPHIQENIEELMMISLEILEAMVQQIEKLMVEHLIVEKKQKNFLELSLVVVLDKVQQVLVETLMVVDTVVKMVVVAIKEILLIHILLIKVNTILF